MPMQLKKAIIRLKNENKDAKRAKKEMIFINGQVRHLISTQHSMLFSYRRQNRSKAARPPNKQQLKTPAMNAWQVKEGNSIW